MAFDSGYESLRSSEVGRETERLKRGSDEYRQQLEDIKRLEEQYDRENDEERKKSINKRLTDEYNKRRELEKSLAKQAQKYVDDNWKKSFKAKSLAEKKEYQKQAREMHSENLRRIKEKYEAEFEKAKDNEKKLAALREQQRRDVATEQEEYKKATEGVASKVALSKGSAVLGKAMNDFTNKIDSALEEITSYQSKIEARLQGSGESFKKIEKDVTNAVGASAFVQQKALFQNISTLIDKGVAYNIEERAFLQTMTDKIVTTFDAFDSNLLRLIRLQQADITASRMGMEASLTQVLNTMFHDTSYLSDVYDTVSGAILEANSLLSKGASTSFEYNVQKWLGSLYSLGFSSDAVSAIAQGINYLATGNVSALTGNQALSSLFALSAGRSGMDYAKALKDGIDGAGVNDLMSGMIQYLQEISTNTDSRIVLSAYANLFGMSVADLKAVSSITQGELKDLLKINMDYQGSLDELNKQFKQLPSRLTQGEMIKNLAENLIYSSASGIASTPALYATWLVTSAIEGATGGTHLPSVFAVGTGIDLSPFTIEGMIKAGVGVGGLIAGIGGIMKSMGSNFGGFNANMFDWAAETTRGTSFMGLTGGIETGTSMSISRTASGSQEDIKSGAVSSVVEEAKSTSGTAPEYDFDDLYNALFVAGEQIPIQVTLDEEALKKLIAGIYTGSTEKEVSGSIIEVLGQIATNTIPSTEWALNMPYNQ